MAEQVGIYPQDPFVPPCPPNPPGTFPAPVLRELFPVGALYFTTVNVNPGVLLGFGTWVQVGQTKLLEGRP